MGSAAVGMCLSAIGMRCQSIVLCDRTTGCTKGIVYHQGDILFQSFRRVKWREEVRHPKQVAGQGGIATPMAEKPPSQDFGLSKRLGVIEGSEQEVHRALPKNERPFGRFGSSVLVTRRSLIPWTGAFGSSDEAFPSGSKNSECCWLTQIPGKAMDAVPASKCLPGAGARLPDMPVYRESYNFGQKKGPRGGGGGGGSAIPRRDKV